MSNVDTIDDAYEMIVEIGRMCDHEKEAVQLAKEIGDKFEKLPVSEKPETSVAYLIWENPMMTVSENTFIDHLLSRCGFKNVFANHPKFEGKRYPEISEEDLKVANPDRILLSSEPFPFKDEHKKKFRELLPKSRVEIVDGEMFSWYGSRLLQAADYLLEQKNT
jgi:ABC-type Fe3+-hydroxamate transport system substrate-binding protein